MGCDGGTIPTRDELVKLKKKPEQKDVDGHRLYKWQHCALTQEPLAKPVVACEMGRLYNKAAVLELLLSKDRTGAPAWAAHLEKLRDVVELQLAPNPAYSGSRASVGDGMYVDRLVSPYICPVTGLEMNGRFKFVFAWSINRVVAERAIKILQKDPAEAGNFKEEDLIVLNPEEDEIDLMNCKMIARRARLQAERKANKKIHKKEKKDFKVPQTEEERKREKEEEVKAAKKAKKRKIEETATSSDKAGTSGSFNPFADQARREREEDARPERAGPSVTSRMAEISKLVTQVQNKSIQDGAGSEVYKKLFTTHKDAINQPKGNWVTFDPRYHFG